MACSLNTTPFASHNPVIPKVFRSNHVTQINGGLSSSRWRVHIPRAMQVNNNQIFWLQKARKHILKHEKHLDLVPSFATQSDLIPLFPTVSDVIKKFYTCINEKNLVELDDIIASDCVLEDLNFPHSFQGKKEVLNFIGQLVQSMGENVHFRLGTICEGSELMASLHWHLEWMEDKIPFSRGSSIFQCSVEEDRLVIRKAQIIWETPFKTGELGLGLLKILASLFDDFPKAAKWFLKSPQTIFKVVFTIYNMLLAPIMNPILAFYVILWKLVIRLLGSVISTLHLIAKFFHKMSSNGNPTTQA
ncbi:hypothetical protein KSS87_011995 [Heliosperma pusillum]|nr:hypothetical protein KSS87_011995 [Heliosperma pusillum]